MATKKRLMLSERNVAAEARAVEAGHRARVQDGGWVKVTSDTHGDLGKHYRVEFYADATDGLVRFTCSPEGPRAYNDDHFYASSGLPGIAPCMHAALAARRLEREGLARYDEHGRWEATPAVLEALRARLAAQAPADPFAGLPS